MALALPAAAVAACTSFWELHALLHTFVSLALLLGFVPRLPAMPCTLFANWTRGLRNEDGTEPSNHGRAPPPLRPSLPPPLPPLPWTTARP